MFNVGQWVIVNSLNASGHIGWVGQVVEVLSTSSARVYLALNPVTGDFLDLAECEIDAIAA